MKNTLFRPNAIVAALVPLLLAPTAYANNSNDVMVVTASGFEQQVKDAPASISVITRQDLETKPFRDLTDALKDIPGVTVTGGAGATDISIRGMSGKYTLILVDGKRQSSRETRPNSDGPGIEQGWIPPLSAIERIEVVRGPMSSLYGSDAMGGVINIITRKVADKWGGSVRLDTTIQDNSDAGNPNNGNIYVNGPLVNDLLGVQLYGKYSQRPEDKFLDGYPEQRLGSFNSKFSLTPNDKNTFELELGTSLQKRFATAGNSVTKDSEHRSRRENQSISHRGQWGFATSDLSVAHEKTDNYVRKMKVENTVVDGQVLLPLPSNMLTLGGQYKTEKLDDKGNQYDTTLTRLTRWNYALFMENEWRVTDTFALTGGLRYDYDENYGDHWNPRAYAVWNLTDEFTLKGGVSTGFTTPSLRQVVSDWGQVTGGKSRNGMILGNPNLKPEKTTNYEASFNYSDDDGRSASLTGFYTQFKDKIQSYYECDDKTNSRLCISSNGRGFDFIQSRENVDKATLQGVEVTGKLPITTSVKLSTTYTYTHTEQKSGTNKGKPLNRIPDQQFNATVDWQAHERANAWVKANYNGKETSVSKSTEGNKYPGYTTWDLGATWKVNKETSLYSGIYNVFDKKVSQDDYAKTEDGRRYWIGINVDF